ncbi:MAG: hypothetical protein HY954_02230 [Deltaproteobacteria bacterium]|nr:hypothetical protein [Deltaproteobacteria bacterium]
MPVVRVKEEVIKIAAARGPNRVVEYEVREFAEPGSIPSWFPSVILLLRDEIQEDEKIIVQDKVIRIVKKTPIDRFFEWVKGRKPQNSGEADNGKSEKEPPSYSH